MKRLLLIFLIIAFTATGVYAHPWFGDGTGAPTASPTFTGIITVPAGSAAAPSIVSDDADSGFYFGSKGFNWGVDGVNKFSVTSAGVGSFASYLTVNGSIQTSLVLAVGHDNTLILQNRNFTAVDNMVEMATGTTTFTGFDGGIVGVNIMPTVGALDDGDTMTLLKLAPQGTPASTLGILNGMSFGNWDGTGTDKAHMFDVTATGYDATFKGTVSNLTADAASVAAGGSTKTFTHTRSLAADGDDACGGTDDCLTLPIPTTMGYLEIWTGGSLYLSAICVNAGTCTVITDSDAAGTDIEYNAAIGDCAGLCLHDGGTNSIIFNDTAGAVVVTVRMTYD